MMKAIHLDRDAGFTLLEVAIAGSVAFMVAMGLFSAIRLASEQGAHIDKKRDERHFLSDLKYILANPVLCRGSMDLKQDFKKGQEIRLSLGKGLEVGKGSTMAQYGISVDSLKVADAVQYSEIRSYQRPIDCTGPSVEKFEFQKGELVRVVPKEDEDTCFGELISSSKSFYVDLDVNVSALKKGGIKFRSERLARLTVIKRFDKENGEKDLCQAVSVVRVDSNIVTPSEFLLRSTTMPDPNTDLVGFMRAQENPRSVQHAFHSVASGASQARGEDFNPLPLAQEEEKMHQRLAHLPLAKAAEAVAKASAVNSDELPNSVQRAPASIAQAPAATASTRPNTVSACAVNMTADEAADQGLPIIQHGETLWMPLGNCEAKKYICWHGSLTDPGLPIEKSHCGIEENKMSTRELARQIAQAPKKATEVSGCVINRTYEEALEKNLPMFQNGERVSLPAGECLERSFVCFNGSLRDEGRPPTPVAGCKVALAKTR